MTTFLEFLNDLISKHGQGALADQVKSDGSILSRFRSGQGTLSINTIEALLQAGDAVITTKEEFRKLQDALDTVSELWRKERKRNLVTGAGTRKEEK